MTHINTIPDTLDPLQYAYRTNRYTDDAISTALHYCPLPPGQEGKQLCDNAGHRLQLSIQHHRPRQAYHQARDPGIEHIPLKLDPGLPDGLSPGSDRQHHLTTLTLDTGAPRGCVLSPPVLPVHSRVGGHT